MSSSDGGWRAGHASKRPPLSLAWYSPPLSGLIPRSLQVARCARLRPQQHGFLQMWSCTEHVGPALLIITTAWGVPLHVWPRCWHVASLCLQLAQSHHSTMGQVCSYHAIPPSPPPFSSLQDPGGSYWSDLHRARTLAHPAQVPHRQAVRSGASDE